MIELLDDQTESDLAFRHWVDALLGGSTQTADGWVVEGSGLYFSNYGHGEPGTITNQIMLGVDPEFGNGVVKIVQPSTHQRDKGKLTIVGRTQSGQLLLLRMGWLKKNKLSQAVQKNQFSALTALKPVPVLVDGALSTRDWFVVAELSKSSTEIVDQTVGFASACARARSKAGGGPTPVENEPLQKLGLDEKGRTIIVKRFGGTTEVCALQGHVWEALKKLIGDDLVKYTRGGFAVDGVVPSARLLIEIKTGTMTHDVYEALGQLKLYPHLIDLDRNMDPILLLPDTKPLKPTMMAALHAEGVGVFTYSIGKLGQKPKIEFSKEFLSRCKQKAQQEKIPLSG